jgi:preprotein translocase subunit YajC
MGGIIMNNDVTTIILMIVVVGIFYWTTILPQKKREKRLQQMQSELKVGDEIITFAGIYGKVININEQVVTIEASAEKTKLNIAKWSIREVLAPKV